MDIDWQVIKKKVVIGVVAFVGLAIGLNFLASLSANWFARMLVPEVLNETGAEINMDGALRFLPRPTITLSNIKIRFPQGEAINIGSASGNIDFLPLLLLKINIDELDVQGVDFILKKDSVKRILSSKKTAPSLLKILLKGTHFNVEKLSFVNMAISERAQNSVRGYNRNLLEITSSESKVVNLTYHQDLTDGEFVSQLILHQQDKNWSYQFGASLGKPFITVDGNYATDKKVYFGNFRFYAPNQRALSSWLVANPDDFAEMPVDLRGGYAYDSKTLGLSKLMIQSVHTMLKGQAFVNNQDEFYLQLKGKLALSDFLTPSTNRRNPDKKLSHNVLVVTDFLKNKIHKLNGGLNLNINSSHEKITISQGMLRYQGCEFPTWLQLAGEKYFAFSPLSISYAGECEASE